MLSASDESANNSSTTTTCEISEVRDPVWKLDRLGSAGQLFWRRDSGSTTSGGILQRTSTSNKSRVKFNYEVQVLEYLPQEIEFEDESTVLAQISSMLHVVLVGIVCVVATVTTFSWLVR
jgi:hypothetical protein